MRSLFLSLLVLLPFSFSSGAQGTPYKELLKSKPVVISGLEFVAATQGEWPVFNSNGGSIPVDVQLWITNRTAKDFLFSTFVTFRVVLRHLSGKEMVGDCARDGTQLTQPVLIRAGETYCLTRPARFGAHADGGRGFSYEDGTGTVCVWGPIYNRDGFRETRIPRPDRESLVAGRYLLSFSLSSLHEDEGTKRFLKSQAFTGKLPVFWRGEGETGEVSFAVVETPF